VQRKCRLSSFTTFEVFPKRHSLVDVSLLAFFGATADQNDDLQTLFG
jgi:hypothetical protein